MQVESQYVTVEENLRFYSALLGHLISAMDHVIELPERGDTWRLLQTAHLHMRAVDAVLSQVALVRSFSVACQYNTAEFAW